MTGRIKPMSPKLRAQFAICQKKMRQCDQIRRKLHDFAIKLKTRLDTQMKREAVYPDEELLGEIIKLGRKLEQLGLMNIFEPVCQYQPK
jgi:hypothetical protein